MLEVEVGVELVAGRTVLRLRRAGPVDLEERAGNIGDAQLVFLEDFSGTVHFIGV